MITSVCAVIKQFSPHNMYNRVTFPLPRSCFYQASVGCFQRLLIRLIYKLIDWLKISKGRHACACAMMALLLTEDLEPPFDEAPLMVAAIRLR